MTPRAWFSQVNAGSSARGGAGENSPPPRCLPGRVPAFSVLVGWGAGGERGCDVVGADDHDAVRLGGLDAVRGERGRQVSESPAVVLTGVVGGEPGEHGVRADPSLAADHVCDVGEMIDRRRLVVGFGRDGQLAAVLGDERQRAGDDR